MFKKALAVLIVFPFTQLWAQSVADTTFYKEAVQNSISVYRENIREQINLYNGYEYVRQTQTSDDEHPFFNFDDWATGYVVYNGELFDGVPLLYDITSDKLITEHYQSGNEVELIRENVNLFFIAGHRFEKIDLHSVKGSLPQTGFYEILYNGPTKAISLHQKRKLETTGSGEVKISFPKKNRYYIFKNGKFFQVGGKASALKILADEKVALKQFIKSKNLKFSKSPEADLALLAAFYDTLKTTNR